METIIVLALYIIGVYVAYFQIQRWADHEVTEHDEYQLLFILSLASWLIYPVYVLVSLIRKAREG